MFFSSSMFVKIVIFATVVSFVKLFCGFRCFSLPFLFTKIVICAIVAPDVSVCLFVGLSLP